MQIARFILISVLCLISARVAPAEERQVIEIRTIGFPPYGIASNKQLSGIYYDLANTLATKSGYKPSNDVSPYSRIIQAIKFGTIDMTIMFRYPQLEDFVEYVMPLPSLKTVVIGLQGTSFSNIASLKGKKVAYLRGAKFSDDIDQDNDIIKVPITHFLQGIRLLLAGRVDAIIGPLDPILSAKVNIKNKAVLFGEPLVVDLRTPWVQVSKKSIPRINIDKIKQSYRQLEQQDMLNKLREKYLQQ